MATNNYVKLVDRYTTFLENQNKTDRKDFIRERRMYIIVICALAGVNVTQFIGVI